MGSEMCIRDRGKTWSFTLFSMEWDAFVSDISGSTAVIIASSSDGSRLDYVFDVEVGFFYSFTWKDEMGGTKLRMMLSDSGSGHSGDVYFVRGGDLFSDTWEDSGNDIEIRDTFLVNDHPSDGEWDEMIYFIDADCGSGSSISLTLRDHMSISALERIWGPGASEMGTLGTIPYPSGEYTLTATFTGGSTFLRVRVAGGITQSWTLQRYSIRWSEPPTKTGSSPRMSNTTGTVLWPVSVTTSFRRPSKLSRLISE